MKIGKPLIRGTMDESGKLVLSVERWGDFEFEAAAGHYIKEESIRDIVPPRL